MNNRALSNFSNFALILFVALNFTKFLLDSPLYFAITTICLMALGGACLLMAIKIIPNNSVLHIAWISTVLLGLITALSTNNKTIASLLQLTAHLGFAIILAKNPPRPSTQITLSAIIIAFFFFKISTNTNPEDVFTVSRNYISVIVVLIAGLYYIACEEEKKEPSILVAMAFMAITMWAIGRAGMASGAILLIGAILYKASGKAIVMTLIAATTAALSQIPTSITLPNDDDNPFSTFLIGIERIERLGSGGQRDLINSEYLLRIQDNPVEALIGAPLEKVRSIVEVDGNPHNSYIRLHTTVGALGVVIFLGALVAAYTKLIRKKKYLTLLALTASLFRSAFDSTAFHGPLDIIIFYSIFRAFTETKIVFTKSNPENHDLSKNTHTSTQKRSPPSNLNTHPNR